MKTKYRRAFWPIVNVLPFFSCSKSQERHQSSAKDHDHTRNSQIQVHILYGR